MLMNDQQCLDAMLKALHGADRAILLTHDNPDPDCLASAMALQVLLYERLGVASLIVYGGILGRAENRQMVSVLGIPAMSIDLVQFRPSEQVILIDTQPRSGNNSLPDDLKPAMVLDHHPLRPETLEAAFYDVRVGFGATATLAWRYLRTAGIRPARTLATALFHAIKVETLDLTRETASADVEAYQALLPLIDRTALAQVERAPVPRAYFRKLVSAVAATRVYQDVGITSMGPVDVPDMVAECADMVSRIEGIRWVLCAGEFEDNIYLSMRANELDAHAGALIQALVRNLGRAGGHGTMAGGRIPLTRPYDDIIRDISTRLLDLIGIDDQVGEEL